MLRRDQKTLALARRRRAYLLRKKGMTFRQIGTAIGRLDDPSTPVTGQDARLLVTRYSDQIKKRARFGTSLSNHAIRVVIDENGWASGLHDFRQLKARIRNGEITRSMLLETPGCGKKTVNEIFAWAHERGAVSETSGAKNDP